MEIVSADRIHKETEHLEVYLFNVGQGDHLLLKFPTMEYGIIDFHYETSSNVVEPPSLTYFKELKRTLTEEEFDKIVISFFCISHTDKDHIKGAMETIEWFHKNNVLIQDIWLAGARDIDEYNDFFKGKVNSFIDSLDLTEKLNLNTKSELYNKKLESFFDYFEKWKARNFYDNPDKIKIRGKGEYLCEIRALSLHSKTSGCSVTNIGPFQTQLKDYSNNLSLELIKRLFKVKDNNYNIDKNLISHILKICFNQTNLLFGGDTHIDIWEECLDEYENPDNPFLNLHGDVKSNFIKVSHHGSKNSSSDRLWESIIPENSEVHLAISAGQHGSFKHPHSETLEAIRKVSPDANVNSTNICITCLTETDSNVENHIWYSNHIKNNKNYGKNEPNDLDRFINHVINEDFEIPAEQIKKEFSLFAYIYEIPSNPKLEIKLRVALSDVNAPKDCFYVTHKNKLNSNCK